MIDEVVGALNARTWPAYVHGQLGALVGDAVAPALRPVLGANIDPEPTPAIDLGASKVGGLPHVDSAFVWPTEDDTDEPLALVGQINLAEAGSTLLPDRGLLYLFCIYDSDRAYGYEIDETTAKLVHVAEPGPLVVAERPDGLADDGVLAERRLTLAPSLIAEDRDEEEGGYRHARFDYAVERALDEELVARGGAPCGVVRLLGHAHPFRAETRELIDEENQELLLYVNGYAVDRHAFGEGEFHVVINRDDLAAGRLGTGEILFEPGT